MKPILKALHSPDIKDLPGYFPIDPNNFCFLLQAMIGPEKGDGEESFDIRVCTPEWLSEHNKKVSVILGYGWLIVSKYDYEKIKQTIEKYCDQCEGANWQEIAMKLSRLGHWEFDNYQSGRKD